MQQLRKLRDACEPERTEAMRTPDVAGETER